VQLIKFFKNHKENMPIFGVIIFLMAMMLSLIFLESKYLDQKSTLTTSTTQIHQESDSTAIILRDSIAILHDSIWVLLQSNRGRATYRRVIASQDSSGASKIEVIETSIDTSRSTSETKAMHKDTIYVQSAVSTHNTQIKDSTGSLIEKSKVSQNQDHFQISVFGGGLSDVDLTPSPSLTVGASARFSWHILYTEAVIKTNPLSIHDNITTSLVAGVSLKF